MPLKKRIEDDFIQAVRSKNAEALSCLRLIKAAIKNKEIEKKGDLDEPQVLAILTTMAKQIKESIEQFKKGGRDDLVAKEKAELALIGKYLPKPLAEDEILKLIEEAITETGATSPKEMGKVMQALMPKVRGRADGKTVNELVKKKLIPG